MCGRYVSPDDATIEREFNLVRAEWQFPPSYNVAPTQQVPIVRSDAGVRQGMGVRWGLIPFFAKGVPGKYSTINARIETMQTTASYRGPWLKGQRCLQVAMGFYEWHLDESGRKAPFYIHLIDQAVFGLAALWDRSIRPDGTVIVSCVHITLPANALMSEIHNAGGNPHRMPAIVRKEDREAWLAGSAQDALALLQPYDPGLMVAYEVSGRVNTPKNNDPSLIAPLSSQPG
jgi:putative SOS response-associated peptidase YedK